MTIAELFNEWKSYKKAFVKNSSMAAYTLVYYTHIMPHIGETDLSKLNRKDIQVLYNTLTTTKGLSSKSAGDVIVILRTMLKYAVDEGYTNPIPSRIDKPSQNIEREKDLQVYTIDEQRKILTYIQNNLTFRSLGIMITLCTGIRIGEVCALQWKHIHLDTRTICICSTLRRIYDINEASLIKITKGENVFIDDKGVERRLCKGASGLSVSSPKTKTSNRDIPMIKELFGVLKHFKKVVNDDYFVITGDKKPTEPRTYSNYYKSLILNDVKLGRVIKFHGMRHSFATRMIECGADIKTTSIILGHSDVATTMNLYMHPTSENKTLMMQKTAKRLFK